MRAETITLPTEVAPVKTAAGTWGVSSPRVLSDLFWIGRYGERAESMARLLMAARDRFHVYRHQQDTEESACVPVLMAALGRITGTDTGADNDPAEMIAIVPSTLWSLTVDPGRAGSLVQAVEGLALAARAVRDQMSNDTWVVLANLERALAHRPEPPQSLAEADTLLASAHARTLAGMLTLSGVASESMVRDVGWSMMDIGKRIERGLWLTALLGTTLTTVRGRAAEQTIIESILVACESSVIYRRRTVGQVSVAAVAELMLFDANNPRSLLYQLERLRANLRDLPSASGSSRPERTVEEISMMLRRSIRPAGGGGRRRAPRQAGRPARHDPYRVARSGRGHHRHAAGPAGRDAAAVGARRTGSCRPSPTTMRPTSSATAAGPWAADTTSSMTRCTNFIFSSTCSGRTNGYRS